MIDDGMVVHPPKQYVNDRTMGCFSCRSEKYLAHLFGCIQLVDWTGLDWTGILVFASDRHARAKYTLGMRTICMHVEKLVCGLQNGSVWELKGQSSG